MSLADLEDIVYQCFEDLVLMRLRLRGAVSGNAALAPASAPTLKLINQFLFIIEFDKIK